MKKMLLALGLLLGGVITSAGETLRVHCADGLVVDIEIPDRSLYPSEERYQDYIAFLSRAACGLNCEVDHWETFKPGDGVVRPGDGVAL